MFEVRDNGNWQAQRHASRPERLAGGHFEKMADGGSRMPRRSGKKWRGMAREPARKNQKNNSLYIDLCLGHLVIGICDLFGIWCLELGIFV
jgi:hypothetical protein